MRRTRLTASVVLVGLVLTAAAASRVAASQRSELRQRVLVDTVEYAGALERELERHVGAAYGLRDLFDDGPRISRAAFERAIEALDLAQLPAIHSINVVRPVAPEELAAFLAEKRAEGYPDYVVADRPGTDPEATRWLVSLAAPYASTGHLLGRDVRAVRGLAEPFERARDLGEPALGPVLVDDRTSAEARVVGLAVPIYALGRPTDSLADRREHLVGWVVPTVRTSAFAHGLAASRDLEVEVIDDTAQGEVLVKQVGVAGGDDRFAVEQPMEAYGRRWMLRAAPGPGYAVGVARFAAAGIAALGLLLTAAFGALVHVLGQRSTAAERIAELRTRELAETNDELSVVNDELALRIAELHQHATVDGFVQRATSEVSNARTVQDALERLRTVLLDVTAFDRVGFSERVDERRMLVRDVAGPGAPIAPAGVEYVASRRLWESFATRDLVVIPDTSDAAEGTVERVLWDRGIHGVITLPLVARGEVAGVLTLGTTSPLELSPDDLELLSRVADGIAGPLGALLGLEAERQAAAQLRQVDELKDEFLGIVAHDLRGPLTVVTGYTELLLADHADGTLDPDVVAKGLTAMQRAASDQERLITDLLESQRLALGVALPTRTPIVLADLVRETVRDLASGTAAPVAFDDLSDGVAVSADAEWIRRVVTNLVTNAWKYGSPTIEVALRCGDGTVRAEVRDHGPGIPAADLPRLFQRFTRLERVGPDQPTGTGLGLYICRQLVEAHGGEVGADSRSGAGSTFWFELPTIDAGSYLPA